MCCMFCACACVCVFSFIKNAFQVESNDIKHYYCLLSQIYDPFDATFRKVFGQNVSFLIAVKLFYTFLSLLPAECHDVCNNKPAVAVHTCDATLQCMAGCTDGYVLSETGSDGCPKCACKQPECHSGCEERVRVVSHCKWSYMLGFWIFENLILKNTSRGIWVLV